MKSKGRFGMNRKVIGTEIKKGQGLGNQLFCYVTVRSIAQKKGYEFSILNRELLDSTLKGKAEESFLQLDYGVDCNEVVWNNKYTEKEERLYCGNSKHDIEYGAYIAGADADITEVTTGTLIEGNMQSPEYFEEYREDIKKWLAVKPFYDDKEFYKDNLCILNIRAGEYCGSPELYLRRKYWLDAMKNMKKLRKDMEFMIVTDSVKDANRILPGIPAYHFELCKDYVTIKNAKYLIISNSSFAFFPAYTSETVEYIIAPKYWARHNVSNGYWSSEQNIYNEFMYQDRHGRLFSADECKKELQEYKEHSKAYLKKNQKPDVKRLKLLKMQMRFRRIIYKYEKIRNAIIRRMKEKQYGI